MQNKAKTLLKTVLWLTAICLVNVIIVVVGIPPWVLALIEGPAIFYIVPNLIVKYRSNDQKNPKPRSEKDYWVTKVEPGHVKLCMEGGKPVRLLVGYGYRVGGDDLRDRKSWIVSPRKPKEKVGGGKISLAMYLLEGWVKFVTGYQFVVVGVLKIPTKTNELQLDEITRRKDEFTPSPGREKDVTDHVIVARQQRRWGFTEAETAKGGLVEIDGRKIPADEGVPFDGNGTYLLEIVDLWINYFDIDKDMLLISEEKIEEGVREIIISGLAEQFLGAEGKSKIVRGLESLSDESRPGNTVEILGFRFAQVFLPNFDLSGRFKEGYRQKAAEKQAGIARKEKVDADEKVAEVELRITRMRAQGLAAVTDEELKVITAGASSMKRIFDDPHALAHVLASQQVKQAAGKGATIIAQVGHVGGQGVGFQLPIKPAPDEKPGKEDGESSPSADGGAGKKEVA